MSCCKGLHAYLHSKNTFYFTFSACYFVFFSTKRARMKKCCERFSHLFWQGHAHFGSSSLFPSRGFCPLPTELNVYFLAASVVHNLLEVLDHLLIKLNLTSRISTFDVKIRFWRTSCGPGAVVSWDALNYIVAWNSLLCWRWRLSVFTAFVSLCEGRLMCGNCLFVCLQ